MLEHGGRLQVAARQYGIPVGDWLDLSTGLAPWPFEVPEMPVSVWQRLPESEDGLAERAAEHYAAAHALPVAGAQAAIQNLPYLRAKGNVGILSPSYAEHAHNWRRAGHEVQAISVEDLAIQIPHLDVLVLVNPNNPTGHLWAPECILAWHQQLSSRGGWLVVDEAFMDVTPQHSVACESHRQGLIVLRSLGKFYGLAGVRLGFVLAAQSLLESLEDRLGPWAVSGPARWLGKACLSNPNAQHQQTQRLLQNSKRLKQLLEQQGYSVAGSTAFFHWLRTSQAEALYQHCAQRGVLLRHFSELSGLRLGLPADEQDWQRLTQVLQQFGRSA